VVTLRIPAITPLSAALLWLSGGKIIEGSRTGKIRHGGCGTGILAIAAARLGGAWVHAIDIDPEAI
jgi:predicted RNA methylase